MLFSFLAILESANASPIVAGPNAAARPNIELALRKPRRDLSSGSFIGCSFRVVLGGFMVLLFLTVVLSAIQKGVPCRRTGAFVAARQRAEIATEPRNSLIKRRRHNPLQYQTRRSKQEH